ncbi:uncharacterized protein L203_105160 [Cryptococcus depauperatus CBS 7841]|uniref:Protein ARV n=1 Tax=Cryptococcus depauperatus CBS 7841 TaxID=1295531 RepID=A0A1E3HVD0_9TREE|nr:hypothetical protein L203_05857 [Cryptococcus depauperatus CBS 7841]
MPVCTNCACPTKFVYTTYKTQSNIRLTVCSQCNQFADPLIEHPPLLIFLDLVLLKPRVFLHLLFNRGCLPYSAVSKEVDEDKQSMARCRQLWKDFWVLALTTVVAEAAARLLPAADGSKLSQGRETTMGDVVTVMLRVCTEVVVQHLTTLGLVLVVLRMKGWKVMSRDTRSEKVIRDGRREHFLPILVPLTLLYTSLFPLLFQLFLYPWCTPVPTIHEPILPVSSFSIVSSLPIPISAPSVVLEVEKALQEAWSKGDRIWTGIKLLGDMSAGFGLRVLLPTRPWETAAIILTGTTVTRALEGILS